MEETLSQHYKILRRFLNGGSQAQPPRPNKARDKLLKLSPIQFHELSTDVYDELQRRQASKPPPPGPNGQPPRPRNVPPYLMPKPEFHEKRNQARQKLSTLQQQRFRDLATDVFCELERRFPRFTAGDLPRGPPSRTTSSYSQNGIAPPNGYGPPSRRGSGPNGFGPPPPRSMSRGPPPGGMSGPPPGYPPFDRDSMSSSVPTLPSLGELGGSDNQGPQARQFQSNTIVPNKSTMVEDDDDLSGLEDQYDRRSDAFGLENSMTSKRDTSTTSRSAASSNRDGKALTEAQTQIAGLKDQIGDLEASVRQKDMEIVRLQEFEESNAENKEWLSVKADMEEKLESAERLNQDLREQLERLNIEQENMRSQLDLAKNIGDDGGEWKMKFETLDNEHQNLHLELQEQRKVTEEVRQEASTFLSEMRAMAESSGASWEREEKLARENHRLEEEVKEWKSRYARTKTQLRQVRATSMGLSIARPNGNRFKENDFRQPDGLVKDVHVTKFQIAIDELLQIARSDEPSAVLNHLKTVVLAVRHITQDVDAASDKKDEDSTQRRSKLKSKVSATANNVITASKNYASSGGLSPVSLLDAAASHLTSAVVELVRTVKIRPTPAGELEDDDEPSQESLQSPGYFSVTHSNRRTSGNESVYSAISSPPSNAVRSIKESMSAHHRSISKASNIPTGFANGGGAVKLGFGMRAQDSDLEELKLYLEDQTSILVQSIQSLVNSIRAEDDMKIIRGYMNAIANVVGKVVSSTEAGMREPNASPLLREKAEPVIRSLADCEARLLDASTESETLQNPMQMKEFTNRLPPLAFEIARETKELVQRLDTIDGDDDDDDFN
ncbi:putative cell polarity [Phaeomoniella chlamydospora]|uniref:Putative cell polarity n=1 Tax=Phaeomoniella chlamydospora TaxID=158046 RepID=A0A0G2E6S7_PHACM|nr:putative cell polarity [Phaeomoniella chlamydospora]